MTNIPQIAIVGRTNVGKSTLFNAIRGKRVSVVEDVPGVTRDRNYVVISRHGITFRLVDTGGLVGEEDNALHTSVQQQTRLAIIESDMIIAVFDGLSGVHPLDDIVVAELRKSEKPVLWVANKCEKEVTAQSTGDFYSLGIPEILPVSSAHRVGIKEIFYKIKETFPDCGEVATVLQEENDEVTVDIPAEDEDGELINLNPRTDGKIRVAVIGKPNVGKSSLINKILGEDRLVTSSIAGTTTDSIDVEVKRDGKEFVFVDTAGLRKKGKIEDSTVERYSNLRTLRALAQCDVAVVVLDSSNDLAAIQDTKIAGLAHERGKGLIFVVNKWDLVEKDHKSVKQYESLIYSAFGFASYAPIIFVSALTGRRCPSILETVSEIYDSSRTRLKTSDLNRILEKAIERKSPPAYRGELIRFYFATQISVAPPTIVIFTNNPRKIHFSYIRYLRNFIRENFPFKGVDIKLQFKKKKENA